MRTRKSVIERLLWSPLGSMSQWLAARMVWVWPARAAMSGQWVPFPLTRHVLYMALAAIFNDPPPVLS